MNDTVTDYRICTGCGRNYAPSMSDPEGAADGRAGRGLANRRPLCNGPDVGAVHYGRPFSTPCAPRALAGPSCVSRRVLRAGGATCWCCWYTFEAWLRSSPLVRSIIVLHPVKVCTNTSPSPPPLPLTGHSSAPHNGVHSHCPTALCALHAADGRRALPFHPSSMY